MEVRNRGRTTAVVTSLTTKTLLPVWTQPGRLKSNTGSNPVSNPGHGAGVKGGLVWYPRPFCFHLCISVHSCKGYWTPHQTLALQSLCPWTCKIHIGVWRFWTLFWCWILRRSSWGLCQDQTCRGCRGCDVAAPLPFCIVCPVLPSWHIIWIAIHQ